MAKPADALDYRRVMPCAPDAERMILGSLLDGYLQPDAVTSALAVDDFSLEKHRRILARIVDLYERGEPINRVTLADELIARGQLDSVDGLSYLVTLEAESLPVNLDSYIRLVKDRGILRKTIFACDAVIQRCYRADDGAADVTFDAETLLAKLGDSAQSKIQLRRPEEIMDAHQGGVNGFFHPETHRTQIPTPWPSLNETVGGFKPKQLVVIAARTGVGKSIAAAQIAQWTAQLGHGTAVFSMEMGGDEILTRMICARASVNSFKFQNGYMSREERLDFQRAAAEIAKMPLWIDDSTACTVAAIQSSIRRLRASHSVGIVLIDYLGLLETAGRSENRVQEISAMTRGLKRAARELNIPFVVLSQLNRAAVKDGGEPELHHLRESGSVEQDADVVVFIHTVEKFEPGLPPPAVVDARFIVAKHRGGPTGRCTLNLMRNFTRFDDPKVIADEPKPERLWN